jgi:hypothetical protein
MQCFVYEFENAFLNIIWLNFRLRGLEGLIKIKTEENRYDNSNKLTNQMQQFYKFVT